MPDGPAYHASVRGKGISVYFSPYDFQAPTMTASASQRALSFGVTRFFYTNWNHEKKNNNNKKP